ncbi:MAG: metallophosphoesterase family protein [Pirellulaceae bacterium]
MQSDQRVRFPGRYLQSSQNGQAFSMVQRTCFQGHTHVPGVFTSNMTFLKPEDIDYRYRLSDEKSMINVGSVGQPRDGNWRSCYVILEEPWVTFRRVEYDVEITVNKIYDTPELERFLGDRLREGR